MVQAKCIYATQINRTIRPGHSIEGLWKNLICHPHPHGYCIPLNRINHGPLFIWNIIERKYCRGWIQMAPVMSNIFWSTKCRVFEYATNKQDSMRMKHTTNANSNRYYLPPLELISRQNSIREPWIMVQNCVLFHHMYILFYVGPILPAMHNERNIRQCDYTDAEPSTRMKTKKCIYMYILWLFA